MEKITFKNSRGQKLVGILELPKEENPPVIICLSGLNGHKTYYSFINKLTENLLKKGYAIFRFDYNSHGESDNDWKNFTRKSCKEDFEAAIEFVKTKGINKNKIGIFGTSMGGSTFIQSPREIKAAILHNPYLLPSLYRQWIGKYEGEILRRGYIEYTQRSTGKVIKWGMPLFEESMNLDITPEAKNVECPTLIIFGEKDKISKEQREEIYNLFNCEKEMVIIKDMPHNITTPEQDVEISKLSLNWFNYYLK